LARDLRLLVRERLTQGDTDQQVLDFLVSRYGNFVLLRPPLEWHTTLLWGLPPAVLIAALVGLMIKARRQRPTASGTQALSQDEERRLSTLVDGDLPKP
jgi:cytochrome c-type biogenesis protein CcmH